MTVEPCSASSQRTGREKAVLLLQRIDRVNDRAPTKLPSSSVKTCKQSQGICEGSDEMQASSCADGRAEWLCVILISNDCCNTIKSP